jgi:cupin superfamily acireductone dioxygenase involved in methionine salvage
MRLLDVLYLEMIEFHHENEQHHENNEILLIMRVLLIFQLHLNNDYIYLVINVLQNLLNVSGMKNLVN